MSSGLKEKVENASFIVDWDAGEKYYQIHIFEDPKDKGYFKVSGKIMANGKLELYSEGFNGFPKVTTVEKPFTKSEFKKIVKYLKDTFEEEGFTHNFVDLSQCENIVEITQLLSKSDSRFKLEVKIQA